MVKKTLQEHNKDTDDKLNYNEYKTFAKAVFLEFMKAVDGLSGGDADLNDA